MFVIVEGIHDTGKSSLIEKICQRQPYKLFQSKRLFPELANINNSSISDFATGTNCAIVWFAQTFSQSLFIIFDRLHLSEYSYSRLFRDVDEVIALNRFRMIDDKLAQFNVRMIHLHCNYDILVGRLKDKNKQYTEEHHNKLTDYFNKLIEITKITTYSIDTGKCSEELTYEKATDFIAKGIV